MDWEMGLKGKLLCPFDTILTVPSLHLVFLRREGEVGGGGGGGCRGAAKKEGRTFMSHFANSLQPTLPSQCYTFSTSCEALNSSFSLNRTKTEKQPGAHSNWTFIIPAALTWSSAACSPISLPCSLMTVGGAGCFECEPGLSFKIQLFWFHQSFPTL